MATTAKKPAAKPAPKATPKSTPVKSKSVQSKIKREQSEKKPSMYTVLNGGGIWFKLRQTNITVFDEETQTVRQLRYSPNEMSVWADEQSENIIREQIVFRKKTITVPYNKPNLKNYLDKHPDNTANGGGVFHMVDTAKKAEVEIETEFAVVDAVAMVRDKSIDELLPIALFLNIDVNQKNIEIKRELLTHAKVNPKNFMSMFDNPSVQVRSTIMSAIDFQILNNKESGLFWYDSNKLIVSTPAGKDTLDIATRFCLSEKGSMVLEEIERQLSNI